MQKKVEQLKILLLQIREDEETISDELEEFIEHSGLKPCQFTQLNAFKHKDFSAEIINDYDALFIGGSSDASVLQPEKFNFVGHCCRLIRYCYDHSIPVLASCFGFQLAVLEMGGRVILDKDNMEIGIYPIKCTANAANDPLTYDLPNPFYAVVGHKERADGLPDNCILLAKSQACDYHMIKFKDKPFYGFQFHPEMSRSDLVTRLNRYKDRYLDNLDEADAILKTAIHETTFSNLLIRKFVVRVILGEVTLLQ